MNSRLLALGRGKESTESVSTENTFRAGSVGSGFEERRRSAIKQKQAAEEAADPQRKGRKWTDPECKERQWK
jgi:hypothetical protein